MEEYTRGNGSKISGMEKVMKNTQMETLIPGTMLLASRKERESINGQMAKYMMWNGSMGLSMGMASGKVIC